MKGKRNQICSEAAGAAVQNIVRGDSVGHAHGSHAWAVAALPEPCDALPEPSDTLLAPIVERELWPYESLLCEWSECENFQFNA